MVFLNILLGFFILPLFVNAQFVRPEKCKQPFNAGSTPCSKKAPVQFFYDTEKDRCYAFRYTGCGGNNNKFETAQECEKTCFDPKRVLCPGGSKPTLNVLNKTTPCGHYNNNYSGPACQDAVELKQSSVNYCHEVGAGQCCSVESSEKVKPDMWKLECADGRVKYSPLLPNSTKDKPRYGRVLHGKNCDTNFCPDGYECTMGNYFSYCCK